MDRVTRYKNGITDFNCSEIQTVLKAYNNIDSKILHIPKGSDVLEHTDRLIQHFLTQGNLSLKTPL